MGLVIIVFGLKWIESTIMRVLFSACEKLDQVWCDLRQNSVCILVKHFAGALFIVLRGLQQHTKPLQLLFVILRRHPSNYLRSGTLGSALVVVDPSVCEWTVAHSFCEACQAKIWTFPLSSNVYPALKVPPSVAIDFALSQLVGSRAKSSSKISWLKQNSSLCNDCNQLKNDLPAVNVNDSVLVQHDLEIKSSNKWC